MSNKIPACSVNISAVSCQILPGQLLSSLSVLNFSYQVANEAMFVTVLIVGFIIFLSGFVFKPLANMGANSWIGIRTPFTLSNRSAWKWVHLKSIAPSFFIGSVLVLCSLFLLFIRLDAELKHLLSVGLILVSAFVWIAWMLIFVRQAKRLFVNDSPDEIAVVHNPKLFVFYGVVLGAVLVIAGLAMPSLVEMGPNGFAGIRTPWTLTSVENWQQTHQQLMLPALLGGSILWALTFLFSRFIKAEAVKYSLLTGLLLLMVLTVIIIYW